MITSNINQITLLLMFLSSQDKVLDSLRIFIYVFKPFSNIDFLTFSGGIEMEHWAKLGQKDFGKKESS